MTHKLAARGLEGGAVETVLDKLAASGALDDRRYADAYVRQRGERGHGPRRIAAEL
ncbi:MAG: RecX family transcriptional regulator, partial [Gammaproteobacteria bacterium]